MTTHFASSTDLPMWAVALACVFAMASFGMLLVEMRHRERGGVAIALSGLVAIVSLLASILRPVQIASKESAIGPRVVVLADASRSMALPSDSSQPRSQVRDLAITNLVKSAQDARLLVFDFGEGTPVPHVDKGTGKDGAAATESRMNRSDLATALRTIANMPDERPSAIVVVSDGRLDDPPEGLSKEALRGYVADFHVPIHTVVTSRKEYPDASVRLVAAAGAAVAHVPLPLKIEVGCAGGLSCDELTVTARELREDTTPALLASGIVHIKDGKGAIDLPITFEHAGARILEVAISSPDGDTIEENDRRFITFNVARERVRLLHVAGRPTNDVRALRQWLKSDASVDVIAFFILRTPTDDPRASQDDLALIPFPVDELFSKHLPSFDAVILQDFDAQPYGLERHLPALANYVRAGGGLIMVGGPNSFVAGGYAGTPLAQVLPITLDGSPGATANDLAPFVPEWTDEGKGAPMLAPLRGVIGSELPSMPGSNILGAVRPLGIVLWTHPLLKTKQGVPMPVLAVGEEGDGRSIALGVDGGWLLEFSALGARTVGRGHGALWDGLLGWLMRDPRFEPAQIELVGGCTAGVATHLRVHTPAMSSPSALSIDITRLDKQAKPDKTNSTSTKRIHFDVPLRSGDQFGSNAEVELPALSPGGYTARLRVGNGPTTRRDFACEAGGDEWADSRPDPDRLRAIAEASGGVSKDADDVGSIPLPKPTIVSSERHVVPLAPPWLWALIAATCLGSHWLVRRRSGLS